MKKPTTFLLTLVLLLSLIPSNNASAANSITNRLKGRLLLQVEKGGAIWYVNPTDAQKYQVTFANALSLFQNLALGITDVDLLKIPVDTDSINPDLDTDNDGYSDRTELQNGYSPYIPGSNKGRFKTDNNLAARLKGRLLLQVQRGGAIWYVDVNGIRHNVRWNNLMDLFRKLALGITDKDLEMVGEWHTLVNSYDRYEIKYPNKWSEVTENKITYNNHEIEILIVENTKRININEWLETYYAGMSFSDKKIIKVAGFDAIQTGMAPTIGWEVFETHILKNNKVYIVRLIGKWKIDKIDPIEKENYNKILSTFKFINETAKTIQIKVYFASNKDTPDCSGVAEFLRNVPYTQAVGTAAINETLKGPSMKEGEVATNVIPAGTKLLSLKIESGIAYATFSKELQNYGGDYGGGSCAVSAMRAQIENTLKQFPTVDEVAISVEGVPQNEVLQP